MLSRSRCSIARLRVAKVADVVLFNAGHSWAVGRSDALGKRMSLLAELRQAAESEAAN